MECKGKTNKQTNKTLSAQNQWDEGETLEHLSLDVKHAKPGARGCPAGSPEALGNNVDQDSREPPFRVWINQICFRKLASYPLAAVFLELVRASTGPMWWQTENVTLAQWDTIFPLAVNSVCMIHPPHCVQLFEWRARRGSLSHVWHPAPGILRDAWWLQEMRAGRQKTRRQGHWHFSMTLRSSQEFRTFHSGKISRRKKKSKIIEVGTK